MPILRPKHFQTRCQKKPEAANFREIVGVGFQPPSRKVAAGHSRLQPACTVSYFVNPTGVKAASQTSAPDLESASGSGPSRRSSGSLALPSPSLIHRERDGSSSGDRAPTPPEPPPSSA